MHVNVVAVRMTGTEDGCGVELVAFDVVVFIIKIGKRFKWVEHCNQLFAEAMACICFDKPLVFFALVCLFVLDSLFFPHSVSLCLPVRFFGFIIFNELFIILRFLEVAAMQTATS